MITLMGDIYANCVYVGCFNRQFNGFVQPGPVQRPATVNRSMHSGRARPV
jgi:hypothetical protein